MNQYAPPRSLEATRLNSVRPAPAVSAAVILDLRGAEPRKTMLIDRPLPGQKLVHGQLVPLTSFLNAEEPAPDSRDDFCLAPDDPAFRVFRRKIGYGQRGSIGSDDIARPRSHVMFGHDTQYTLMTTDLN